MNAGDPCPECKVSRLNVANTKIVLGTRKRYLKCRACGYIPEDNIRTVTLAEAPKQPMKHWQRLRYYGSTQPSST